MALETLRLGHVEEQRAATFRIAGAGQGRLRQPFVLGGRSLSAEADVELSIDPRGAQFNENNIQALVEHSVEPVRLRLVRANFLTLVNPVAIQPHGQRTVARSEELNRG